MNEIIEFTYRPKTDAKRVVPTLVTLAFLSAVLVVLSVTVPLYKGLVSLAAVVGITASMYMFLRYAVGDYVYSVTFDGVGQAVFTVVKVVGKRSSTMCCLHLSNFVSVERISSADHKNRKTDYKAQRFNFYPSFSPEAFYLIKSESRGVLSEVIVDITEDVAKRLMEYAAIAKETEPEE